MKFIKNAFSSRAFTIVKRGSFWNIVLLISDTAHNDDNYGDVS